MSDQIREQISAFLDGELPGAESELLLKRLLRDQELRGSFGRYALIGEAVRGSRHLSMQRDFLTMVNSGIDAGAPPVAATVVASSRRWLRPLAGAAVAASVAVVAVVALQQRAGTLPAVAKVATPAPVVAPLAASAALVARNGEARSYTTPRSSGAPQNAIAGARLANYVIAHSQYSSVLSQRDLMTDVIVDADQGSAEPEASGVR